MDVDHDTLPCISSPLEFARSVDPSWSQLTAQDVAHGLSQWCSSSSSSTAQDVPCKELLAAWHFLVGPKADSSNLQLVLEWSQRTLHALGRMPQCQDDSHAALKATLVAAWFASHLLGHGSTPIKQHLGSAAKQQQQWKSVQLAAYSCLKHACAGIQPMLAQPDVEQGTWTSAVMSIGAVVRQALVHQVLLQPTTKPSSSSKQPSHASCLSLQHLADLLILLIQPHVQPGTAADAQFVQQQGSRLSWTLLSQSMMDLVQCACAPITASSTTNDGQPSTHTQTHVINLMVSAFTHIAKHHPQHAVQLLLATAELLTHPTSSTNTPGGTHLTEGMQALLLKITAAVTQAFADPVVSGMVLRSIQGLGGSGRAAVRKVVLDVAAQALASPEVHMARLAAGCLASGCQDRDATVRTRALSGFADQLQHVWLTDLQAQYQEQPQHKDVVSAAHAAHVPTHVKPAVVEGPITPLIVTAICDRLLDATKTVQGRALECLHHVLLLTTSQLPEDMQHTAHHMKQAFAQAAFAPLCCLMDARPNSALFNEGSQQVYEELLQLMMTTIGKTQLLARLLQSLHPHTQHPSSTASDPGGNNTVNDSTPSPSTPGRGHTHNKHASVSVFLSQSSGQAVPLPKTQLLHSLVAMCQPDSPATAYQVWAQHLAQLTTNEQVECVRAVSAHARDGQAIKQEAVRAMCMLLAPGLSMQQPQVLVGELQRLSAAAKCVYCFSRVAMTCTAPTQAAVQCSTAARDLVCEAAILLDLATQAHNVRTTLGGSRCEDDRSIQGQLPATTGFPSHGTEQQTKAAAVPGLTAPAEMTTGGIEAAGNSDGGNADTDGGSGGGGDAATDGGSNGGGDAATDGGSNGGGGGGGGGSRDVIAALQAAADCQEWCLRALHEMVVVQSDPRADCADVVPRQQTTTTSSAQLPHPQQQLLTGQRMQSRSRPAPTTAIADTTAADGATAGHATAVHGTTAVDGATAGHATAVAGSSASKVVHMAVSDLVIQWLTSTLKQLINEAELPIVDAALRLLCACPSGKPLATKLLHRLEQILHSSGARCGARCGDGMAVMITAATASEDYDHDNHQDKQQTVVGVRATCEDVPSRDDTCVQPRAGKQLSAYLLLLQHMCLFYHQEMAAIHTRCAVAYQQSAQGTATEAQQLRVDPASDQQQTRTLAVSATAGGKRKARDGTAGAVAARGRAAGSVTDRSDQNLDGDVAMHQSDPSVSDVPVIGGEAAQQAGSKAAHFDYMAGAEANSAVLDMAQQYLEHVMAATPPATRAPLLAALLPYPPQTVTGVPVAVPAAIQVLAVRALSRLMALSSALATTYQPVLVAIIIQDQTVKLGEAQEQPRNNSSAQQHLVVVEALEAARTLMLLKPNTSGPLLSAVQSLITTLITQPAAVSRSSRSAQPSTQRRLLLQALMCFADVLASDKLQLSGATWRLVGRCALLPDVQAKQVIDQVLRLLLTSQPLPRKSTTTSKAAPHNTCLTRHKAALALYSNCEERLRQQLVEQVLLQGGLLDDDDLASDSLVLPVFQSLTLATSRDARDAALALLARCTPSSRVLAAMSVAVQSQTLGMAHMSGAESRHVLHTLTTFVQRHGAKQRSRDTADGTRASTGGTATAADGGGGKTSQVAQLVAALQCLSAGGQVAPATRAATATNSSVSLRAPKQGSSSRRGSRRV